MRIAPKKKTRFRVGDWVSFLYGTEDLFVQITEFRGPLGFKGRNLYRIRVDDSNGEVDSFEVAEDDIEYAPPLDKEAIINYLKEGGLVEILRTNLGDRRQQPKVWLTYKRCGGVTHTLLAKRGVVGGSLVPYFALHGERVFSGKKEEVAAFLTSFGISRTEAEAIVSAVGTAL